MSAPDAKQPRIPSLDGLRAVAILVVIGVHLGQRYVAGTRYAIFAAPFLADGVGIFFVLSGYLITTLLLREHEATGGISLGMFYLRRTLRIFPPLYAYLLVASVLGLLLHIELSGVAASILFVRNLFIPPGGWLTEHIWSLSLEEQFYLLWPFVFLAVLRRRGRPAVARLAAVLIVAAPLVRIAVHASHIAFLAHKEEYFLFGRMDALMAGCLLAVVVGTPRFERLFARVARVWWLLPLELFLVSGSMTALLGPAWHLTVGLTLDAVVAALFILWCARHASHPVGRLLNSRPMVALGVWSYSLYLWQTLFTHESTKLGFANHLPWSMGLLLVAGWASYTFVEQPSFRLRSRLVARLRSRPEPSPAAHR